MTRLQETFRSLKEIAFTSNGFKEKGHEDIVAETFKRHGFNDYTEGYRQSKDRTVPENSYVFQPFGPQRAPDFMVREKDLFLLECKSSRSRSEPFWNGSVPLPNVIYLLTTAKNGTTFFLGSEICSDNNRTLLEGYWETIRCLAKGFAKKHFETTFVPYTRVTNQGRYVKYFQFSEEWEAKVHKYVGDISDSEREQLRGPSTTLAKFY